MEFKTDAVAVYSEFKAQLAELNELNQSLVFDYADPKQNKEARSHCAKLRKVKTAIEDRRKAAKADALEYGRALDARARELTSEVESMIDVHMTPMTEIENREKARIAYVNDFFTSMDSVSFAPSVEELQARITYMSNFEIDPAVFQDRTEFAMYRRSQTLEQLKLKLAEVKQQIADKEELERLRAEKELVEKQKAQHEAEQQAKSEEQSRIEAAAKLKADQDRLAQERREREEQERRMEDERKRLQADRDKLEAEKRAADKFRVDTELRELDMEHKKSVNRKILASFVAMGVDESIGQKLITAIVKGEIANLKVNY